MITIIGLSPGMCGLAGDGLILLSCLKADSYILYYESSGLRLSRWVSSLEKMSRQWIRLLCVVERREAVQKYFE